MGQAVWRLNWGALRPRGRETHGDPSSYNALEPMTASPEHSGEEFTAQDGGTGEGSPQGPQPQHSQGRTKDPHICEQWWYQQSLASCIPWTVPYPLSVKCH